MAEFDFVHPGYRKPKTQHRMPVPQAITIVALSLLGLLAMFHFGVLPKIAPEAEAAETPDIRDYRAIVEEYEGQTRVLCEQYLAGA